MKTKLTTALLSFAMLSCSAQSIPASYTFVPSGNYTQKEAGNSFSVQAFYVSQEITNKEYREFLSFLEKTPNDTLYLINYQKSALSGNRKMQFDTLIHKNIHPLCMNNAAWKSLAGKENYFYNPSYDDYPVVGVSYAGAQFFCIWKTNQANAANQEIISDFRLPSAIEWEYMASLTKKSTENTALTKVSNQPNANSIQHLADNVAEWVTKQAAAYKTKGGSWQKGSSLVLEEVSRDGAGRSDIGFRVVLTFLKK